MLIDVSGLAWLKPGLGFQNREPGPNLKACQSPGPGLGSSPACIPYMVIIAESFKMCSRMTTNNEKDWRLKKREK